MITRPKTIPPRFLRPLALASLLCCSVSGCGDEDPTGPSPASIPKLFGNQLFRADGSSVGIQVLSDAPVIGVYFASVGCSACGAFTPLLVDAYHQLEEGGRSFEVVLVSLGVSDSALFEYMEESDMPWLAVSPQSSKANDLVERYNVRWVPTLVIIDAAGNTLSMTGRDEVTQEGAGAYDAWLALSGGI